MYLIPLVRTGRAISSCLLFPEYPMEAIAASEIISYIGPFINYPPINLNVIGFTIYLIYDPIYARELMHIYKNQNMLYYKLEVILLTIFLCNYIL
tara:strand:+ start:18 stop:302 length:285 start_codon:yes stop_codon:yes gene_type:complete